MGFNNLALNITDIIFLLIILISVIIGLFRGFAKEALALTSWFISGWLSIKYYGMAFTNGYKKAEFGIYKSAANLGDPEAQLLLGIAYDEGTFTKRNKKESVYWLNEVIKKNLTGKSKKFKELAQERLLLIESNEGIKGYCTKELDTIDTDLLLTDCTHL